ncbi:MAG: SurA N-terminal domain-containing protein [Bacteroidales bacterium]|jgi:peptidyl-prolyl cis-trans isomerase D|nr:SurA N-terminal domain-containing protein [Bacteroidales bacterium]
MAVLQKIRNKAGIFVIIFVGVALFLFIIDPSTFQVIFNQNDTSVAKINNKKVDYTEFQSYYNYHKNFVLVMQRKSSVTAEEDQRLSQLAWNEILQEYIFDPFVKNVGLSVSDEEMEDLLYGSNIHYIIQQYFTNQETGVIDTTWVRNFFDRAEEDEQTYIIAEYFKRIIKQDRITNKYDNMVAKGFYAPVALAKMDYEEKNNSFDFELLAKNYRNIADTDITFNDSDLQKYYNEHKYLYNENNESRELEYVIFDIIPSSEDTVAIKNEITELYEEFNELSSGFNEFALSNDDLRTQQFFISENELPHGLPEDFFEQETGTTSDIILNYDTYYFTRITEIAVRPDSVRLSHILFLANDTVTIEQCIAKADSIKKLAQNGEDFSLLAFLNSNDDESKVKGGDMGWFTESELRTDINDIAFKGNVGDIETLEANYGVHIFKITDQPAKHRKIKLATINKIVRFSDYTVNQRFAEASNFVVNNPTGAEFDQAVIDKHLAKRIATVGELDNRVSNIQDARNIVRWAYGKDTKIGSVSEVFTFPDKYIVAKVSSIRPKGTTPFEMVKDKVETAVIRDKKAERFIAEFNNEISSSSNLASFAQKEGYKLDSLSKIKFSEFSIPGIGTEPKILGVVDAIDANKISHPIKGNNGVYVLKVYNSTVAPEKTDYSSDQLNIMRSQSGQVYRINEALQKKAKIEDNRARFL